MKVECTSGFKTFVVCIKICSVHAPIHVTSYWQVYQQFAGETFVIAVAPSVREGEWKKQIGARQGEQDLLLFETATALFLFSILGHVRRHQQLSLQCYRRLEGSNDRHTHEKGHTTARGDAFVITVLLWGHSVESYERKRKLWP